MNTFNHIKQSIVSSYQNLALIVFGILLCLCFITPPSFAKQQFNQEQVDEILFHIHAYYVEDLPLSNIDKHNFDKLLTQLDPYSKYLSETELEAIFSAANGRYTGIGIEVEIIANHVVIINTLPGSPADLAGLEGGDKLVAINNYNVANKDIEYVSKLLKKSEYSTINITVERQAHQLTLALRRQEISLESVSSQMLSNGNGYLSLSSFNNNSYHDVARHLNKLALKHGAALNGLVIDLRDNPGGTLTSAVAISDLFLNAGTIVSTKGRFYDANQHFTAQSGDVLNGAPVVVMINGNSASAAEILAGALQDNHRALVVGTPSYGKGSVQSLIPIGNGTTALKLTTARYFTPSGRSIEGTGIAPDITLTNQVLSHLSKSAIMAGEQTVKNKQLARLDSHILNAKKLLKNH
ncbi:putative CtpA-like serine protease [Pseudoalteromonas sp. CIP111854]|uniref:CtpA-like serine protease n=1 Tax=Pseudoalteromonas holothuriae TaxID=2963714 RepID=A0A9W4QWB8_9GAMM|nr:S41 family peptidase [Pseudoalteromonas sp. CIP111854]CAH9056101.1 putative CtpA-like serine protease [Pseudoalteromonas sp. CIP111854]